MKTYTVASRWRILQPVLLVLAFIAAGVATLWYFQKPAFLFARGPNRTGLVPVPISGVAITAYTKVTRDHLWDPKNQNISVVWMRPEQVTQQMHTRLDQIIGRVLDHDKMAGYVFTEEDFLPKGTRPGIVAGIPPGKRALRLEADKLQGLVGLRRGDRFDLISALALDPANNTFSGAGIYANQMQMQANMSNWKKQATVRVIVQNGVVVEPMSVRNVPIANRTLTQGTVIRTRPVQEIVIAMDPHEVPRLAEALAVDAEINCVPRSGHPDDPAESRTPGFAPFNPFSGTGGYIDSGPVPQTAPIPLRPAAPPQQTAPAAQSSEAPPAPPPVAGPVVTGRFTNIETINGNKRELVAAPVQRR